jgi:hypothetical protein
MVINTDSLICTTKRGHRMDLVSGFAAKEPEQVQLPLTVECPEQLAELPRCDGRAGAVPGHTGLAAVVEPVSPGHAAFRLYACIPAF